MSASEDDKTSVVASDTFKIRMTEAGNTPPSFVLLVGPGEPGKQWFLDKPVMVVGRSVECDVAVDDRSISRKHAQLNVTGNKVMITDLASSNGTEVAGKKLEANKSLLLEDNQHVKTGNVIFKYLQKGNIESIANQQTMEKAMKDALTGAFNRRALEAKMLELLRNASITDTPLSLIVFDLDKFKSVNDTYGHAAGDFVLKELVKVVQAQLRQSDFFARYGGEEFTLTLWGSNLQRSTEIAERIRNSIEAHAFIYEGKKLPITISAGIAQLKESEQKWEELFERADQAAYASKQGGRNRVTKAD